MNARKLLAGAAIAAALAGGALGTASAYTSSENYFLDLQASRGSRVWDYPTMYVNTANWVCNRLNYVTDIVASELLAFNPSHTYASESQFMWDAVTAPCPWHDHSYERGFLA